MTTPRICFPWFTGIPSMAFWFGKSSQAIDPEGLLWLRKIKTESPAVLEYYGLEASTLRLDTAYSKTSIPS